MKINELVEVSPEDQLEWLETRFKNEAEAAGEDISSFLAGLAWDKPFGSILVLDPSILVEMLENPESTDLGWAIQERLTATSDDRAIAINEGTELTPKELSAAEAIARKRQIDEVYMSESGVFCSGSTFTVNNTETAFIAFTGEALGQGGIDYSFYRVFSDADAALRHFKSQPDVWLPLLY